MSAIPLARLLVEFEPGPDLGHGPTSRSSLRASDPARIAQDMAARVAEAAARGREEGRAAAKAECDGQLDAQRAEWEQRLVSERQTWAAQEGTALAEQIRAAARDMEARIGESVARILAPFLSERLQGQAVDELIALVQAAVSKDKTATVAVSGPADLVDALRDKLGGGGVNVAFSIADAPDVQVTVNDTILQTRIEAWMARIREAVA